MALASDKSPSTTRSSCNLVATSTNLWHHCLGHLSSSRSQFLSKTLLDFPFQLNNMCDVCPLAKQTRPPFGISSISTSKVFSLIHCDIWGSHKIPILSGGRYFLTMVNDYTRFIWVFFMHHKNETQHILESFFPMSKQNLI